MGVTLDRLNQWVGDAQPGAMLRYADGDCTGPTLDIAIGLRLARLEAAGLLRRHRRPEGPPDQPDRPWSFWAVRTDRPVPRAWPDLPEHQGRPVDRIVAALLNGPKSGPELVELCGLSNNDLHNKLTDLVRAGKVVRQGMTADRRARIYALPERAAA